MKKFLFLIAMTLFGPCYATVTVVPPNLINTTLTMPGVGDEAIITSAGSITNTAQVGVQMTNASQITLNSGVISTTGGAAHGVFNYGVSPLINNSGSISTTGNAAYCLYNNGGVNAVIGNSGTLTTLGLSAHALVSANNGSQIGNSGTITTVQNNSFGIWNAGGANTVVTNSGTISTLGSSAHCIDNDGVGVNINNTGPLTTTAINSYGIFNNNGTSSVILNLGQISTTGNSAYGILNSGLGSQVTTAGKISTVGTSSYAIWNTANNSTITNSGTILTDAASAHGLFNDTANHVVMTNEGLITTLAASSMFNNTSTGSVLINTGRLIASATRGIQDTNSTGTLIINSGVIYGATQAINIVTPFSAPTLSLLLESNLQGSVHIDTFPLNLAVQTGLNLALTLDATSTSFGLLNIKAPYVVQEDPIIAVIDPTGLAMQSDMTADIADTLLQGIYSHRGCFTPGGWTEVIGSYRKRNQQPQTLAYTDWLAGGLVGYDTFFAGQSFSIFGGGMYGQEDIAASPQQATIILGCGGLAYEGWYCNNFVGLSALGAYVNWDNTRTVMNNLAPGGMDQGQAHINGAFIASDLMLGRALPSLFCHPFLTFNLRYAELFLGSYTEKGSLTNLTINNRNVGLITTRLEAAFWGTRRTSFLEPFIGVFGRYQVVGKEVKGVLLGQSIYFDQGGPLNLIAGLIGLRGSQTFGVIRSLFNAEVSFDNADSTRFLGEVGLKF